MTSDLPGTFLVSVIIPTYNRPEPLKRALRSVLRQVLPDHLEMEVLVVDNSADNSAKSIMAEPEFIAFGGALKYVSEPDPGVANARNTGIEHAAGKWIAFLDDDMEAAKGWIAALARSLEVTNGDASFGPIAARLEHGQAGDRLVQFFSRSLTEADNADVTHLAAYLGTGNSMFDKAACQLSGHAFDPSLNEAGGEDSLLLRRLAISGKTFIWSEGADSVEWVPAGRANWQYVARRRFLSGQIRTLVNHKLSPPRWDRIAFYMAVGLAQTLVWFPISLLLRPFDGMRAAEYRSKAWGGLGKLFWGKRFRAKLYGTRLVS